ncbi:MAG: hypothetical protein K0Q76_2077 [Panacagrimonas sp.]|jgi:hypothetical protein|nr:hypothetical protein [Panacagrimonas sp.]
MSSPSQEKSCCAPAPHAQVAASAHSAHAHAPGAHGGSAASLATAATLHCLSGCAIGEFAGLLIGVSLGLPAAATMVLATVLGFLSGYALGLRPLVRRGMGVGAAFRAIWLGETVSIAVMEAAMNLADYHVGGMSVSSVLAPRFWLGYGAALIAGFLAAWPVNLWLLRKQFKKPCH